MWVKYSIIALSYYAGFRFFSRLGIHLDYFYSTQNGTFVSNANSQVKIRLLLFIHKMIVVSFIGVKNLKQKQEQ